MKELEKASREEKFRIYDGILDHLKAFLKRPRMFATSVEATYATFHTLICCLDVVADTEGEALTKKHRTFMVKHKNPGALVWPSGITQDELIEHFQDFYKTHIAIPIPAAPFTPEEIKEFLGDMPVRQEIEVLGPDEAKDLKLGLIMTEKMGIGVTNETDE
tara:strand:+ start:189 stop:671 length:483 start_codon:yes stop_codon:yes gene_type:complete